MKVSWPFGAALRGEARSEEHTSELQSQSNLVCRLLLEKKKLHIHITPYLIKPSSSGASSTPVSLEVVASVDFVHPARLEVTYAAGCGGACTAVPQATGA